MANNDSLSFFELIGAPLLSFVQAEFQATQTTLEFIERLGFTGEGKNGELGELKMMRFRQHQSDEQGRNKPVDVEIPLLSMVPIPIMQVKQADLEFELKITDYQEFRGNGVLNNSAHSRRGDFKGSAQSDQQDDPDDFMSPNLLQMKAVMANSGGNSATKREAQMKVKLRLEPSDFPTGLSHLLELMDKGVKSSPVENPVHSIKLFFSNNVQTAPEGFTLFLGDNYPQFTLRAKVLDKEGNSVPAGTEITCLVNGANLTINNHSSRDPKEKRNNSRASALTNENGIALFVIEDFKAGDQLYISCRADDFLSKTHLVSIKQ